MDNDGLIKQIKNNIPLVYEAGKNKGIKEMQPQLEEKYAEGVEEGYDNGLSVAIDAQEAFLTDKPKTHYDAFWDVFQSKGTPTRYYWRFAYSNWNDDNYNPKYDIIGMDAKNALGNAYYSSDITDTKVVIDATRVPNGLDATFYWARALKRIRKLVVTESTTFKSAFSDCKALISIDEIEGKIGQNINLKDCVLLNKGSIERLVEALSNTTTELTLTLSSGAVANAFTDEEWTALETTKPNWTISLV